MLKPIIVQIGHDLPSVKVKTLPTRDDALDKAKRVIAGLKQDNSRLLDRIGRLVEDDEWEIREWEATLEAGSRKETEESIKRRISRLRGACAYQGIIDYDNLDKIER